MKNALLIALCLILLTGCTSPAPAEPATEPTPGFSDTATDITEPDNTPKETIPSSEPTEPATEPSEETQLPEPLSQPLLLAEKCEELLAMDYPVFLLAGVRIMEAEYSDKYAPAEGAGELDIIRYEQTLHGIPYLNAYGMDLNLSKNGEILFSYPAPTPEGNVETIVVLDLSAAGWEQPPTEAEAYSQLLDLAVGADGAYATACEWLFSTLLQDNPAAFAQALNQRPDDEIQQIAQFISWDFFYSNSLDELEQIANSLTEETVKNALLDAITERKA